jgi:ATP-dependent Clp protease ATP-binding subunit ClpA
MGMDPVSALEPLLDQVGQRAVTPAAADRLDAAVHLSAEHAATADRLLDHVVAEARAAGMSWTDIGARLGVSKQAARQRFADRATPALPFAARPGPRLHACLRQAGVAATAAGAAEIGTDHLLAGLLAEGVAAAILERVGVTAEGIRSTADRLFGRPDGSADDVAVAPPMSVEAVRALDGAAHFAAVGDAGNAEPEVRPEHLLAALALDPGSRARRVLNGLGTDIAAIKGELQCHITLQPRRPARWWKRRTPTETAGCSFCGRTPTATGQLVNGPGVRICGGCVDLAHDILRTKAPA